jgi:probable rRNA maturation factor
MIELTLTNRQRAVRVNLKWLREAADAALKATLALHTDDVFPLHSLDEIDIAIVSDAAIERVHTDFMQISGATDVITFDHGEIIISAETAVRCAKDHGHSVDEELALYITHGFLHLAGYDDIKPADRRKMHAVQNRIWRDLRTIR